jgi:hypothetical protein
VTFANPWLLLGTLAALIPLLVHLFDRRRPRQVPFAALSFVLRSQRRTASRLRLKRLLLYALRTLLLLAIPIALARPEFTSGRTVGAGHGLAATAVVLDTSLAMRWRDGSTLFEAGRDQAKAALRDLSPEEPATFLACTRTPAPVAPPGFERTRLLSAVDDVKPGYEPGDLNRCLDAAAHALDDSVLPNRRIVVVSAFTQSELHLEAKPPTSAGLQGQRLKPEIVLRDVSKGQTLDNRAIIDAHAEPAPQVGPRAWQFTFTVRNYSKTPAKDVELRLEVNGEMVAKGFVDLAAEGTAQKTLAFRFTHGGPALVTGVLAGDALVEDDARSMVVSVPRELTALVVNGAPNPQKYRDEAFFFDSALSATGSPVRAVVRDADAAWREQLSAYDVVLLLNVEAPSAEQARALEAFVENGGGLFFSVGDHVDPDAWNAVAAGLLPRKLRVVKTAVEPGAPDAPSRAARLQNVSLEHPVFAPFTGRAREGLLSTRFFRYALFEGDSPGVVSEVLATMDDGAPVFFAARRGKGRVLVYASTVDRDWSDLPIRTAFLPLAQRIAAWLTGTLDEREEVRARVGATVTLQPDPGVSLAFARSPGGVDVPLTPVPQSTAVTGGPLPEPGRYVVTDAKGQAIEALSFAATLDPAASDLSRHEPEALTAWFGEDAVKTSGPSSERHTPVWTWLLVVAVLAFFFEGVLLRK